MPEHSYLAIEGVIGVGKTTLARILGEALPAEILLEVFEENPFLGDFYSDRARYAFQTQIFFLLSRYRQQHNVITKTLLRGSLVSDYLFAKDWLFAHLNLSGDELGMYERVHGILGEQIPAPELVVFLAASTDALMERIAFRDRAYERQMSRSYIDDLRLAYEQFFSDYTTAPVLRIDTDHLDFVRDSAARADVVSKVRNGLSASTYQPRLPELADEAEFSACSETISREGPLRLSELQRQHRNDKQPGEPNSDAYLNYLLLTAEIGNLGGELARAWQIENTSLQRVGNRMEARQAAFESGSELIQNELADALAALLQIANDTGIDLEQAYFRKMSKRSQR